MKKILVITSIVASLFAYNIDTFKDDMMVDINKLQALLDTDTADKSAKIYDILKDKLDVELMSKLVLSQYYKDLTPAKQEEFVNLFMTRLQKDFASKIDLAHNSNLHLEDYGYDDKRCYANISMKFEDQNKNMMFKFRRIGNECKLYDIEILKTSLIASYRAQYLDIIKQSGLNTLFEKLK